MPEEPYVHLAFQNTAADADPNLTFKVLGDDSSTENYAKAKAEIAAEGFIHEVDLGITGSQMVHLFVDHYGVQRVHDADNKASLEQLRAMNDMVVAMRDLGLV
ncbi:MAG: hypothetical protein M1272_05570 [Firmicutes bacterium]|nr:hypothetical protein [Bacillota bacterium]